MDKKITDYRTEYQKKMDAKRAELYSRYVELREEGLSHWRACEIVGQEQGWTASGVAKNTKRFESQENNQPKSEQQ